jgi:hypothetical protein
MWKIECDGSTARDGDTLRYLDAGETKRGQGMTQNNNNILDISCAKLILNMVQKVFKKINIFNPFCFPTAPPFLLLFF